MTDDHKHHFQRDTTWDYKCRLCDRGYFGIKWLLKAAVTGPNTYIYTVEHDRPIGGMTRSFDVLLGVRGEAQDV